MICTSATSYRRKRWVLPEVDGELAARLANEARIPGLVGRVLVQRGMSTAGEIQQFLEPRFKDLYSPYLLPNMGVAAERIARAVSDREKITLYGDYDVDGITGTAMLWHTLKAAGANVETYIPHRVNEGYGLNSEAVARLIDGGTRLLVTIDCGCSAVEPIALARARGIDVVVSDHHEFGSELPAATAIVHPRLPMGDPPYPNGDLCGAGVAFKLAWAVAQKICGTERVNEVYRRLLVDFTALTALGTIADVVPLTGENRIIVKYGLAQLAHTQIDGVRALMHAAGYGDDEGQKKVDCMAVGFTLAPRLNAAGRMGHAREAVELLTTAQGARADEIAAYLEAQNRERQATERRMVEIAHLQVRPAVEGGGTEVVAELPFVIVVAHESFHAGVVGIVASRLVDAYHRPTFVLARGETELHGSARSIVGFELHHAIEHVRELLLSGGGHAMAGGVKLSCKHLAEFRERLNLFAAERLDEEALTPKMPLDGVLTLGECQPEIIEVLERLAPFGRGNPQPRFLIENVKLTAPPRRVGATGAHLQLTVGCEGKIARGIAFKMGALEPQLPVGTMLNLVVEPRVDTFNGMKKVDLVVSDIARCSHEPFDV